MGVVYRHPTTLTGDYETFSERLYNVFYNLNCNHIPFYALGDYNIDLLAIRSNNNRKYVNNLLSSPCKCVIDVPTRISDHSKTLIDHIYVNDDKHSYVSGAVLSDLSDHYGTFIVALVKKKFQETLKYFNFRDMSTFKIKCFCRIWKMI